MGTRDRVGSLQIIRQLLAHDALVIDPSCTPLITEMENATYNIRRPEDMLGDDHAIDALRYAVWQAQTTLVSKRILSNGAR
jgi:phage terminase large subunit